jgi:hypothetical protein
MSFALAVLGGLAGGGRALKGIALAKAQAESDLAVEQEKTKAEVAKITAQERKEAAERKAVLDKEEKNKRQATIDSHNNRVTDGRHLHTYSLNDYKIFGQNAELFDQTATVDLESNYGQTLQGVLETGQRHSFLAEGDDPARAENRFFQELTEPVIINNSTRTKQWELPYIAHERMKKRFGPTPSPKQQELLDKSEAEYKRVFSGLATMYTDIIDKRAKLTAEIELGGEGGRAVTPLGAYNVLFSETGIKEIFNNSPVPNEIINKHVILPALDTTRKVLEGDNKLGYLLKINETGEATDLVTIPPDISNNDVNEVINEKENAGASATDANNATADSIASATAISESTGGKLTPQASLKGVVEFEKMIASTDEQTGLPITTLNANKATGLLRFEVNVALGLKNPDAITNYETALRVVVGNGTIGIETGLPRYLGMQEVVANTIRQKLVEQSDPSSGFIRGYQDTEFAEYLPTLQSLNRSELTNQIVTVEDSLTMANELLSQTTAYLEAQATGAALPFNTGFSQRLFAAKQGGIQQLKQLGFRIDDAGSFLEYADGGTDEELFNYMTDLAEEAGFRVDASTGELIPPSSRTYVGAYRKFLEVQFIYMLARSLENPEGGGARLSVADIENMRDAFGSGGFLNDPGLQLMALQRMTQNFSLQYFHLKALERSTSPVQYAAAMHLADNQRFKGFKRNATAAEKQEVIVDFFTEAIGRERGPMIDEIRDEAPYNPYEQNEGGSTDDSEQPYTPDYVG